MLVTPLVSHVEICPYVAIAAASSVHQASTAAQMLSLVIVYPVRRRSCGRSPNVLRRRGPDHEPEVAASRPVQIGTNWRDVGGQMVLFVEFTCIFNRLLATYGHTPSPFFTNKC